MTFTHLLLLSLSLSWLTSSGCDLYIDQPEPTPADDDGKVDEDVKELKLCRAISLRGDGLPLEYSQVHRYSPQHGKRIESVKFDATGMIEHLENSYEVENGNIVKHTSVRDGTVESITHTTYNDKNQPFLTRRDVGGDGVTDSLLVELWHDQDNHSFLSSHYPASSTLDFDDFEVSYVRDDQGRVIRELTISQNDDAKRVSVTVLAYDDLRHTITRETDIGGDGIVNSRTWIQKTKTGDVTRFERDENADGSEEICDTRYDESGNQLGVHCHNPQTNQTLSLSSYHYDDQGREISHESDDDGDGEIDFWTTTEWDNEGNYEKTLSRVKNGDREFLHYSVHRYSADDRTLTREDDRGWDGVIDSFVVETFDQHGRVTVRDSKQALNNDGIWNSAHTIYRSENCP